VHHLAQNGAVPAHHIIAALAVGRNDAVLDDFDEVFDYYFNKLNQSVCFCNTPGSAQLIHGPRRAYGARRRKRLLVQVSKILPMATRGGKFQSAGETKTANRPEKCSQLIRRPGPFEQARRFLRGGNNESQVVLSDPLMRDLALLGMTAG
jgi:hypothetical protein